ARGPLFRLPAGPVQMVLGGEYDWDRIFSKLMANFSDFPFLQPQSLLDPPQRKSYALFSEIRIPLVSNAEHPQAGEKLAMTLAARYDSYYSLGSKATPQFGAEWRPFESLLVRGSYGKAFKVPSLYNLYLPSVPFSTPVFDPLTSQTEFVSATFGGNSSLRPETGQSRTIGIVYSNDSLSDLHLSLTHWSVDEANSIQNLDAQTAVSNENLFPGLVVRTNCGIPPCPIDHVSTTYVNFGEIRLRGVDAQLDLRYRTPFGDFTPSLSATETYHYVVALQPGVPPTDRVSKANDDRNFAPRWKGT